MLRRPMIFTVSEVGRTTCGLCGGGRRKGPQCASNKETTMEVRLRVSEFHTFAKSTLFLWNRM